MEEESSAIPMEQRVELLEARLHEKEQQVEALTQLVQQLALRVERLEKERTQSGPRAHPATPALQKPKALATAARGGSGVGANPHPQIKRETATTNTTASSVRLPSRRASMPTSNKKGATVHKKTPTTAATATATATSNGSGSAAQPPKQPQQKPLQKKASSAAGSSGSSPGLKVVDGEAFQYWPLKGKAYYPSHYQVPPPSNNAPPSSELSLQWVHGYRGSDRVNNLQYLNDEEIIYFTAATCVIQNLDKHQQRFFSHQDDILCLALHPSKKIAATGEVGKNGRICIWNTSDMQLITCIENAGSGGVECLAFSQGEQGEEEGSILVSVERSRCLVSVWDWKKGSCLVADKGQNDKTIAVAFNPHLTKKASDSKEKQAKPSKGALSRYSYGFVTCGNKSIKFWSLDASGSLKSKKGVFGTKGPIQTISAVSFNDNGATVSGTVSGDIYIWKDNLLADVIAAHPKFVIYGIKKIVGDDTYAFISGAKDGSICLWDSDFTLLKRYEGRDLFLQQTEGGDSAVSSDAEQEKQKTAKETNPVAIKCVDWHDRHILFGTSHNSIHQIDDLEAGRPSVIVKAHYGDLYGLATHENYFATCGDDGRLCLWSCSPTNRLEKEVYLGRSAHAAAFSANGEYLAVGTETGHIMVFKSPELHQCWSTQVHVHNSTPAIRQLRFSPDDRYLAITQENVIHLYALEEEGSCSYRSVGTLKGHTSAIIHCDFSEDSKYLQTDSNSYELLYWDLENMQMVMHPGAIRDVDYHTWSCVLGWAVVGIWPPGSDGTDVNAVSRSSDRKLLVTGDDFNGVKLFSYPVTKPQAAHKRYAGHSSHVMNVSFAAGDNKVVSVGGKDHSVFQWALI